jgi:Tfp pilus assembly protein PilX
MAARTMKKASHRGVALLVSVIFTAVMLSFAFLITSLAYKQTILARTARDSAYAFYAADAALECLLRFDQRDPENDAFTKVESYPISCGGSTAVVAMSGSTNVLTGSSNYFSVGNGKYCAVVHVQKPADGIGKTWLFADGYSDTCAAIGRNGAQFAVRGLKAAY